MCTPVSASSTSTYVHQCQRARLLHMYTSVSVLDFYICTPESASSTSTYVHQCQRARLQSTHVHQCQRARLQSTHVHQCQRARLLHMYTSVSDLDFYICTPVSATSTSTYVHQCQRPRLPHIMRINVSEPPALTLVPLY